MTIPLGLYGAARPVASAWTPASLPSLAAWWDASALALSDSAVVSSWSDLSGNGRTLATAPGSGAATFRTGIRNGLPVVRFDGVNDCLLATDVIPADTTYEMTLVLAVTGGGGLRVPLANQSSGTRVGGAMILSGATVRGIYGVGAYVTYAGGAYTPNTWERWALTSAASLYVNGAAAQTSAALAAGGNIRIGAASRTVNDDAEFYTPMDVAEVVISSSVLSSGDRASLDAYLADKWGF